MTRMHARGIAALLASGALVWTLAGCAPTPALDPTTGETLQGGVVEIAQRADAGDLSGALAELDLFEGELAAASEEGRIDAEREAEVREALALVRADLDSALAEQEAAEADAAAEESAAIEPEAGDGDSDPGAGTEPDHTEPDDSEPDNSGPGNNNGNGNGNSGPGNNNGNGGGSGNG